MCTKKVTFSSDIFKPTKTRDKGSTFLSMIPKIRLIPGKWINETKEEVKLLEWLKDKLAGQGLQSEIEYHGDWFWNIKIMINCREITISAGPDRSSSIAQLCIIIYTVNYEPEIDICLSWPFYKRNKPEECRNEIERPSNKIDSILKSDTRIHNVKWFNQRKDSKVYDEIELPSQRN